MAALDRRLLRYARATRGFVIACAVIGVLQAGLIVLGAGLLATVITRAFLGGAGLADLTGELVGLVAVFAGRAVLAWAAEIAAHRASAAVKSELRERLLRRVVDLGPRWLAGKRSGELATLVTRGVDALDGYFARYLPQLLLAGLVPLLVGAQLLAADWVSALIVAVTLPLIPLFMVLVGFSTKTRLDRQWQTLQALAHHFLDVLSGLGTLKAFGRSRAQVATLRRMADQQRRATQATLRLAFLSSLVLELLATLSVAVVAVSVGLRLLHGALDLHTALVVLILAPEVYLPLRQVGVHYHASAEGLGAAERVFAVLDEPVPERAGTTPGSVPGSAPGAEPRAVAGTAPIRLQDVTVANADRDGPALDGLTLTIPPGQVTGLVGPSGAGKSTVLAALLGVVRPDRGRVLVGDTDLAALDPVAWRQRVGWLPQHPVLFAGTVADNIRLGDPDAGELAVRRAARVAAVDVPLHREIGERGDDLSSGQRRRVALARALLGGAPLLLLDEPTEGVDGATESALTEALPEVLAGRTVVVVTHRPALLRWCDRVVTLPAAREAAPAP